MNYWTQSKNNIFVAAHRGWKEKYPENTMLAFKKAIELNVDQLETDIRMTKDGELILIHDATVDRTTNGTGNVHEFTLEEIRKLDAGNGEQIPTLREFLELVKEQSTLTIDLELKVYPVENFEEVSYHICNKTIEMVEEFNLADRCVFNSGHGDLLKYIYEKYNNKYKLHTYFPVAEKPWSWDHFITKSYCGCVFGILEGKVTVDEIKELSEKTSVRVWAGTYARNEEAIDKCIEMGTELITCNNPDEVLEILRKKNLHK